jgi:glycosyltransferase involved in cell wall biosynthesis
MERDLISVVIPVFNAEAFLAETVASILAQDYRPLEVIVVDDGSSDGSLAVAEKLRPAIRVLHQPNAGPAAARNRGIELAQGSYLAFSDADDLWAPGRLARQHGVLQREPRLDMVLGLTRMQYRPDAGDHAARFRSDEEAIVLFSFGAGLFRRAIFERVGLLSEDLRNTEDADWFMRAREKGAEWLIENSVAQTYRRHGANMTERLPLERSEVFRVLARAAARQRARGEDPARYERLSDRRERNK